MFNGPYYLQWYVDKHCNYWVYKRIIYIGNNTVVFTHNITHLVVIMK